ncbi:hypothetical protein FRB95_005838 [Tulasnella sp. JGI-2019a]|nr:hypothetical protein FRB95_005838 [Tulasnella sp. JGI-2019a]
MTTGRPRSLATLTIMELRMLPSASPTITTTDDDQPVNELYYVCAGHIYNNYYLNSDDGINTRDGAQLLIQNNVFSGIDKPIYATDVGYAVAQGNDLGGGTNTAPVGTLTTVPYSYTLDAVTAVKANVVGVAGATLAF